MTGSRHRATNAHGKWSVSVLAIALLSVAGSESAFGQEIRIMYKEPVGASGRCLAPVTDVREAKDILSRNGVRIRGNAKQITSVAQGVQQIEMLNGGVWDFLEGARFTFPKTLGNSRQTPTGIEMGANHTDGNVAHVMHELGHFVGNNGFYGPYKRVVRKPCLFTHYCSVHYKNAPRRNEEFAEAFSAFVTHPELLKKSKQKACRVAYKFFQAQFDNSPRYAVCDRAKLTAAAARHRGGYYVQNDLEPEDIQPSRSRGTASVQ